MMQDHGEKAGFIVPEALSLRPHYIKTLDIWATALEANADTAIAITVRRGLRPLYEVPSWLPKPFHRRVLRREPRDLPEGRCVARRRDVRCRRTGCADAALEGLRCQRLRDRTRHLPSRRGSRISTIRGAHPWAAEYSGRAEPRSPNAKRFTVRGMLGGGELWISELVLTYDEQPYLRREHHGIRGGK